MKLLATIRRLMNPSVRVRCSRRQRDCRTEPLESRQLLAATYSLLRDIDTADEARDSDPRKFTRIGSSVYFFAQTADIGWELWRSDGTTNGTTIVRDINPGLGGSPGTWILDDFGHPLFPAYDPVHGTELWTTDGTAESTVRISEVGVGIEGSDTFDIRNLNGTLVFDGNDGSGGRELWLWPSGAIAPTMIDINPGAAPSYPNYFVQVGSLIYFAATQSTTGTELWRTDGTPGGTYMVYDAYPGSVGISPASLVEVNGTLVFSADNIGNGREIWRSDGTPAGTQLIADINPGTASSVPSGFTVMNGQVYFSASDGVTGFELWVTDGTGPGTTRIRDINPGSNPSIWTNLVNVNGMLYFGGTDGNNGVELWRSDGTSNGTVMLRDITPGSGSSTPGYLTNVSGTLYFAATNAASGRELWISNGTTNGTQLVKDTNPGTASGSPRNLANAGGTLWFAANNGVDGNEVWKSDGTANGTEMVRNLNSSNSSSSPESGVQIGDNILFFAETASHGRELWRTNGTTAGTTLVRDIAVGPSSSISFGRPVEVNGIAYFAAGDSTSGIELWRSDGTPGGTYQVADIAPGTASSLPNYLTNVAGTLYFTAYDPSGDNELWKSDGTTLGTNSVANINISSSSSPAWLTNVNGYLYFSAESEANGRELWITDGTAVNTQLVADITPGTGNSLPSNLTNSNGYLLFTATTSVGTELWISNGNSFGTHLLKDIDPGAGSSSPGNLTVVGDRVFFTATSATGQELWTTDRTAEGTIGWDLNSGAASSSPAALTNVNGILAFTASTATGIDLWKVTPSLLASQVHDFPSATQAGINHLTNVNGRLFFGASDATSPNSLWSVDLTAGPPERHPAAAGQPSIQYPAGITPFKGGVVFSGIATERGDELHRIPIFGVPQITAPSTATPSQRPLMTWTAVPGATSYQVWIKNQSTNVNPYRQATVAGTSYTPDADLGVGRFNLWVRAVNDIGETGPWTPQYNFTVNTEPVFTAIPRLQPTARPLLSWGALVGAARYDLWINNLTTGIQQVVRNTNVTSTSWSSTSDMPMGLYRAWVRTIDAAGNIGRWSAALDFHVLPGANLVNPIAPTFDRRPTFTWNAVAGALSYELTLRNRNTGVVVHSITGLTSTSWTPPSNLADGPYRWWVNAVAPGNFRSQAAPYADIYIGGITTVLAPSGTISNQTPAFLWQSVTGAASYSLFVSRIDVFVSGIISVTSLTTSSYIPVTPLPRGTYRTWVRTISTTGETTAWSSPVTFTIARMDDPTSGDSLLPGLLTPLANLSALRPIEVALVEPGQKALSAVFDLTDEPSAASEPRAIIEPDQSCPRTEPTIRHATPASAPLPVRLLDKVMTQMPETGLPDANSTPAMRVRQRRS